MRVHHFARQLASPFPLLAAMAARTSRIEIGTGVIDMRYENPLYMAEEAAATDLLSDGRLQLGVSRGSPETALRGSEAFGYVPPEGSSDADLARDKTALFLAADPRADRGRRRPADDRRVPPAGWRSSRSRRAWPTASGGARAPGRTAEWTAQQGMNLMSSTLLVEDTGVPFDELQAEQIARFRAAWAEAGWEREPRVSVSRSVLPIVSDLDRAVLRRRAVRARTRSASSRACGPGSARATSASPTRSPRSSPRTPPSARPTPC